MVNYLCWDLNGDYLAYVSEESLKVWSLAKGECIHEFSSMENNSLLVFFILVIQHFCWLADCGTCSKRDFISFISINLLNVSMMTTSERDLLFVMLNPISQHSIAYSVIHEMHLPVLSLISNKFTTGQHGEGTSFF